MRTSFNLRGFSIVLTLEDAFYLLENHGLDHLQIRNQIQRVLQVVGLPDYSLEDIYK